MYELLTTIGATRPRDGLPSRISIDNRDMSRRLRVIVASALLAAAMLGAIVVASEIATTYYLPSTSNAWATKHTALFGPAITGTVVAVLAVAVLVGHLVTATKHRPRRWMWLVASGAALIAVSSPVLVAGLGRPDW
jgi:hypothetical protein